MKRYSTFEVSNPLPFLKGEFYAVVEYPEDAVERVVDVVRSESVDKDRLLEVFARNAAAMPVEPEEHGWRIDYEHNGKVIPMHFPASLGQEAFNDYFDENLRFRTRYQTGGRVEERQKAPLLGAASPLLAPQTELATEASVQVQYAVR